MTNRKARSEGRSIGLTRATLSYVAFTLLLLAVALLVDKQFYWLNAGAFQSVVDNAMPYVLGLPDRGATQPVELWTLALGPLVLLLVATPAIAQLDRAWLQWISRGERPSGVFGLRFDSIGQGLLVREFVWRGFFAVVALGTLHLLTWGSAQFTIQFDPGSTALTSLAALAIVMAIGLGNPGGAATVLGSKDGGVRFGAYLAVLGLCCVSMFLVGAASVAVTAFFAARELMRDDSALGILLFVTTNPVYGIGYSATIIGMILVGLPFRVWLAHVQIRTHSTEPLDQ